ncbi:MAG: dihydroorotate dehydrogenase electron transfer subunit, partial [Phycisphaerae bacterium]|nr:dihydroorotate dehydrogenase electron transfer subunit [Phycisphaerae bacterium]
RGLFLATVVSNARLCRDHFRLVLSMADFPPTAPGQFVQINCQARCETADEPAEHAWRSESDPGLRTRSLVGPLPLLRRPFSLAGDRPGPAGGTTRLLEIIGRAIGVGTSRLAMLAPGETLDLIGPLGNSFPMPSAGQAALLVGGGVGIPPMIYLAEAVAKLGNPAIAIAGVTTVDFLPLTCDDNIRPSAELPSLCAGEFSRFGVPTLIASDDGTVGLRGLVTDALARVLDSQRLAADRVVIYTCGPERMMRAVTELATSRGIRVWVAMERAMACGIGTCQSCVCKVRRLDQSDWSYKLVCTDGTIFDGREIVW